MKKYLAIFKMKLIESFIEREIAIIWAMTRIITLTTILSVWMASDSEIIGSFSKKELLSYYFILFLLDAFIAIEVFWEMRRQIMNGTITNFLLKPVSFMSFLLSNEIGFKTIEISIRFLIGIITYFLIRNIITLNINFLVISKLIPAIIFAFALEFLLGFVLGCFTFIWTESRFINDFKWILASFLGGKLIPLTLFPQLFKKALILNPFRYIVSFSAEIVLGKINGVEYYFGLLISLIWIFLFAILAQILWKIGLRKYSAFGS